MRGENAFDDGERDWSAASAHQETPKIGGHRQKLGGGEEGFSPTSFRGSTALPTLTSSFQNCEKINFCCLKAPSLWYFVKVALSD